MYYDFLQDVVAKLKEVGHEIADYGDVGSIITAIEVTPDGKIHARCALETSFSPAMVHKGVYQYTAAADTKLFYFPVPTREKQVEWMVSENTSRKRRR